MSLGEAIMASGDKPVKVAALFQFYLLHYLPRTADWAGQSFVMQVGDAKIVITPRDANDPLFPETLDKDLSRLDVGLEIKPGVRMQKRVADFCQDRIQAVVIREIQSVGDADQLEEEFLALAIRSCNTFLDRCRTVGHITFLQGIERDFVRETKKYSVLAPHTISWHEVMPDGGNKPLNLYPPGINKVSGTLRPGSLRSPERGSVSFAEVNRALLSNESHIVISMILDAQEWITAQRLREAVLALATAIEVASDQYLKRKDKLDDNAIENILRMKVSFAEKRFKLVTEAIDNRSLLSDDAASYESIKDLYRTRNSVEHEGILTFKSDDGVVVEVDQERALKFLAACESGVRWLESL
jgi:hypothetical protein